MRVFVSISLLLVFSLLLLLSACIVQPKVRSFKLEAGGSRFHVDLVLHNKYPDTLQHMSIAQIKREIFIFDSICNRFDVRPNIRNNDDYSVVTVNFSIFDIPTFNRLAYQYFSRHNPSFSFRNPSPVFITTEYTATKVHLTVSKQQIEESSGVVIIECEEKDKKVLPDSHLSGFDVTRPSENRYRFMLNEYATDTQYISLTYVSNSPILPSISEIEKADSNSRPDMVLPKQKAPETPLWQRENFWLFLFALLGAVVSALEIHNRIIRKKRKDGAS